MRISDWSSDVCSSDLIASNNSGGLGYQFGAFYFDEKLDISSFEFGGPTDATPSAIAIQRQDSEAYGLFGSVNYAFDNGLKFQAGARYNHDTRDFVASRPVETRDRKSTRLNSSH